MRAIFFGKHHPRIMVWYGNRMVGFDVAPSVFSHGPMRNVGFLGRWGIYACPQCLPSDTVPIRSWTRTLRPLGIRHRHLLYHGCATVDATSGYAWLELYFVFLRYGLHVLCTLRS